MDSKKWQQVEGRGVCNVVLFILEEDDEITVHCHEEESFQYYRYRFMIRARDWIKWNKSKVEFGNKQEI